MCYTHCLFNRNAESDSHAGLAYVSDALDFLENIFVFILAVNLAAQWLYRPFPFSQ